MLTLTVTITGIADAQAALDRVGAPGLPQTIARRVAKEAVLPKLAQYPPASRRKQPFVSAQSRKYFFAALRSGALVVPYRRSGALGRPDNWTQAATGDGLTLTSKQQYSDLVRTKGKQAKYFAGVWPTTEMVARSCAADAALVATAVLVEIIGNAGP